MNKMHVIAKIALTILGLFVVLQIARQLFYSFPFFSISEISISVITTSCISVTFVIALGIAIVRELIVKGDKWASKIVNYSDEMSSLTVEGWIPITYRLISIILGILFIYWTFPSIFWVITSIIVNESSGSEVGQSYRSSTESLLPRFISSSIRLLITVYLLCGAPHFVRWQVKKTLELCKQPKTEEQT